MLDKFKIALVLLIIGLVSGLAIWGTYTLTEERIAENQERERLSVYLEMFPDMDVINGMEVEVIEHSVVFEKISIFNSNGNLLGYAMRGSTTNAHGVVDVVVGTDPSGLIIDVVITNTTNTPGYVQGISDNIAAFKGQNLSDVSYDSNTGATATYNSVRSIIEASVLLVQGDPVLDAYSNLIDSVTRYQDGFEFNLGAVNVEVELIDGNDVIVGHAYKGVITVDGTEYSVAVVIDSNDVFKGFVVLEDSTEALDSAIAAFDADVDSAIDGLEFVGSNDVEDQLAELANMAFMRAVEDEETRTLREYFINADRLGAEETIGVAPLESVRNIYDADDNLLGFVYYAEAEGYKFFDDGSLIELEIVIDVDGNLASVVVGDHGESSGISDPAFDAIDSIYGQDSVDGYDDDAYAGATYTGDAIRGAISAALENASERAGE